MVRAPCCEKMGLKRGPWSSEEDQILVSYINQYGHGNWRALPKQAGLLRCGKSCRLRWINYLKPDIKRGNFSKEEEETIINLHQMLGNRWSAIAARLPGRTDNEIKNVWHTQWKKKLKDNSRSDSKVLESSNFNTSKKVDTSPREYSSEMSSVTNSSMEKPFVKIEEMDYSLDYLPQIDESFWSEDPSTGAVNVPNCDEEEKLKFRFPTNDMKNVKLDSKDDDNMNFWYNLFIRNGDMPDLPEF